MLLKLSFWLRLCARDASRVPADATTMTDPLNINTHGPAALDRGFPTVDWRLIAAFYQATYADDAECLVCPADARPEPAGLVPLRLQE